MKYKIYEMTLNEYIDSPTQVSIEEIDANSQQEAEQIAKMRYPNREIKVSLSSVE